MTSPVDEEAEESEAHGGATVGSFVDVGVDTMEIETPQACTVVMENNDASFRKDARTTRDAEDQSRIQACLAILFS